MKCKICGQEFKRGLAMHEQYCKGNNKKDDNKKGNNKKDDNKKDDNKKNNECDHEFILLDKNIPGQKRAINGGYSAYCKKCKDLV